MKPMLPLLFAACLPCAQVQAQTQTDSLALVAWMAGCWAEQGREPGSVEQWMPPAGGLMLGMARTLKGGRVVDFEFMQIRTGADGRLIYIDQPQGRTATEFKYTRQAGQKDTEAVFENPAHGFPQRVVYRLTSANRLASRIEGTLNGKELSVDSTLQRTPCP